MIKKVSVLLTVVLISLMCLCISAYADEDFSSYTIKDGGVLDTGAEWTYYNEGVLVLGGNGAVPDYTSYSLSPWYKYRTSITSVVIGDTITAIGASSFGEMTALGSITIGEGVKSIGNNAFYNAAYVTSINWNAAEVTDLPSGNKTFYSCGTRAGGIAVVFGEKVLSVPDNAFCATATGAYAPNILSVTVGNSVKSIGDNAFYGCTKMTQAAISDSVKTIGDSAFCNCNALATLTMGNAVETIGNNAFENCYALTSIVIPDTVISLGDKAFRECRVAKTLYIGKNITYIPAETFYNTKQLEEIIWNAVSVEDFEVDNKTFYYAGTSKNIAKLTFGDGVTRIPDYAFNPVKSGGYAPGIYSVSIPDSVTYIGKNAFYCCSKITEASIGNGTKTIGDSAFYNCNALATLTMGNAVETIGNNAFENCYALTSIVIPDTVISLGDKAFRECRAAKTLYIGKNITYIPAETFYNTKQLEEIIWNAVSVADFEVDNKTFYYAGTSKSKFTLTFGDGVTVIPDYAFNPVKSGGYAPQITEVSIPDTVKRIGNYAFFGCNKLNDVSIGSAVTEIGDYAFRYCTSLEAISLPASVKAIGDYCFSECLQLNDISFSSSLESIGDYAFYDCNCLTEITIPDSVTSMGSYVFNSCDSLEKANLGNGLDTISPHAFDGCYMLGDVTIPLSVKTIGEYAFYDCQNIESVIVPDSVTDIGKYAFCNCYNLKDITIGKNVKTIGDNAFSDTPLLEEINWNSENADNLSEDSNIFSSSGYGTEGILLNIGEGVKNIPEYAFSSSSGGNAPYITGVVLPSTIKKIGNRAFYNCQSIKKMSYSGSPLAWEAIDKGTYTTDVPSVTISFGSQDTEKVLITYSEDSNKITIISTIPLYDALVPVALCSSDGDITEMGCMTVSMSGGIKTFDSPVSAPESGEKIRIFLWEGYGNIRPLCKSMEY